MIYQRCSPISRFQFASIAFLCTIYFPYTFHSNVWSLLIQPVDQRNCSDIDSRNSSSILTFQLFNRSICCSCEKFSQNRDLYRTCRFWHDELRQIDRRKLTLLDEWNILCQPDHRLKLFRASLTFFLAEILGLVFFSLLADRFGRKIILLICLYIPVLFGSLAAFTTNFFLFLVLRWPVGFFNKPLLILVFLMVIESTEFKFRAQIASLLLASIPVYGILIAVVYFFLLDWRHLQLFGSLMTTLTICYPWLISESRRWYVNSHRVSRVNKLFSSNDSSNSPWNKLTSATSAPSSIYDKPIISQDSIHVEIGSFSSFIFNTQIRTISACLTVLWFLTSFSYQITIFPTLIADPILNNVFMNVVDFSSFIIGFFLAPRIGRRVPLAVLILISGLSSISLAVAFLGSGNLWLEMVLSMMVRICLRICFCLLTLFTAELYPTSIRATGLALALSNEILAKILLETILFFSADRTLILFISGGFLCLTCCLIFPLPETLLYDLPDSLNDLQSMNPANNESQIIPTSHYHMIDANTVSCQRRIEPVGTMTTTTELNDLLSLSPQTMLGTNPVEDRNAPVSTTNQCYFASVQDTIEQYQADCQQHIDNRMMITLRANQNRFENTRL